MIISWYLFLFLDVYYIIILSSALQHSQQAFVPIIVQAQIEPSYLARVAGKCWE